jgi:hypothetical protein
MPIRKHITGTLDADAVETKSLVIGGTLYVEDANSPINVSGTTSTTFSLDTPASDEVIIIPDKTTFGFDQLQVNGDTGQNYEQVDTADGKTTGNTQWSKLRPIRVRKYTLLNDRDSEIQLGVDKIGSATTETARGSNTNAAGDITQFTFIDSGGSTRSFKARVFRRAMSV